MKIRIPVSLRSPLVRLSNLTQETFERYIAIVDGVPATMSQERFTAALKNGTSDATDLEPFVDAAFGLHAGFRAASVTPDEFAADVAESLSESDGKELTDLDQLKARIRALLNVKSLTVASRARGLLLETERHAIELRIVSDIRPVFDKPGTSILGAIVMHSLRIAYHEKTETEAIFVSLDSDDLKELSNLAHRAMEKEKMLSALVVSSGLTLIQDEINDKQETTSL